MSSPRSLPLYKNLSLCMPSNTIATPRMMTPHRLTFTPSSNLWPFTPERNLPGGPPVPRGHREWGWGDLQRSLQACQGRSLPPKATPGKPQRSHRPSQPEREGRLRVQEAEETRTPCFCDTKQESTGLALGGFKKNVTPTIQQRTCHFKSLVLDKSRIYSVLEEHNVMFSRVTLKAVHVSEVC